MIGKVISSILSNDAEVIAIVGDRIYPIIMEQDTIIPAIVYEVDNLTPEYTKTGWEYDEAEFTVTGIEKSYKLGQILAFKIRKALELKRGTYASVNIERIQMTDSSEEYDIGGDTYIFKINFTTKINSYGSY